MTNPPDDFVGALGKADAAEKARQAAIANPPRPKRTTNTAGRAAAQQAYIDNALREEVEAFAALTKGNRNNELNTAAFNLAQLVNPTGVEPGVKGLDPQEIKRQLEDACKRNGIWDDPDDGPTQCEKTMRSGYSAGYKMPRDLSEVGRDAGKTPAETKPVNAKNGKETELEKTLRLRRLSTVKSRVPTWVWEYDGIGRMQLGTLSMFAGKPMAGKSTAARWFAARLSKGELPGVWCGNPMKVAVVMAEEQTDAVVVPGLVAAGANMDNIFTPEIKYGDMESSLRVEDVQQLREELLDNQVRALFIDPIMSMFSGKADIYRNNEVRQALDPFKTLAKDINGIVVGVTHLRKGDVRDVLGGINGSAAFGELPRAVFGFAPIIDKDYVMEQVKNSAGPVGLKLAYQLPIRYIIADDDQPIELPTFNITGETEISIADIDPNNDETTNISVACDWLKMYLLENQPAQSSQVKRDAKTNGDIGDRMISRAAKRLGVRIVARSAPGKPHMTVWMLPDNESGP